MRLSIIFLGLLGLCLLGFDAYAVRCVLCKDVYTKPQMPWLLGVIIFVPFLGAGLVLYLAKNEYQGSLSKNASVDDDAEGVCFANNDESDENDV